MDAFFLFTIMVRAYTYVKIIFYKNVSKYHF